MSENQAFGPTYYEMLDPDRIDAATRRRAREAESHNPTDPVNLYNITWKDAGGRVRLVVVPRELTNVAANIVLLSGKGFPTGSHKVGAAYSVAMENQLLGSICPGKHTLVWPSTGNYGIGGAWVGPRMGYDSLVILPEGMSSERFERIRGYGARCVTTPGSESNVKEIYDKCRELVSADPQRYRVLNQFESMGNYRFHYYVTGNTVVEALRELEGHGVGNGRCAAFVSAMGSAGTIAAGDRLKEAFPECRIVGLEPIQCPTLYANGYGRHEIQGIGDKHVTWIHNVRNMDALICVDDVECLLGLQLLTDAAGAGFLEREVGIPGTQLEELSGSTGISGVCNLLGAAKTAKYYSLGPEHTVVTVATDAMDRYRSVMEALAQRFGGIDERTAAVRLESIFRNVKLDYVQEGTTSNRERWFNLKYYTWVEQQGKTVEELDAQRSEDYWVRQRELVRDIDERLLESRAGRLSQ